MVNIQSVIYDKQYFTKAEAIKHLKAHKNLKFNKIDETKRYYRFRQKDPEYSKFRYRTVNTENGVKFIVGYPLKTNPNEYGSGDNNKIPYSKAIQILKVIKPCLEKQLGINLYIVGSILRKEAMIGDLDFIYTGKKIKNIKQQHDCQMLDKWKLNIDFFHVKDLMFGKFLRTYPKYIIISIRKALKKNGYKLTGDKIVKLSDMKKVNIKSIKDIFKLAGIKYRSYTAKSNS